MKIILLSHLFPNCNFPTNGIFNLSRAKALQSAGHEVLVIAPISLNPHLRFFSPRLRITELINYYSLLFSIPEIEVIKEIQVFHPRWIKPPNKIFSRYHAIALHFFIGKKILSIIKIYKPNLIISTWLNPFGAYCKYIRKKVDIICFTIGEGCDVLRFPFLFRGWKSIEKSINENCESVIAVSDRMKRQMLQQTNLINVKLLRNGYDDGIFFFNESRKVEKGNCLKLLHIGNFYIVKGQDILLKSITKINIPIKLTFVGTGPELESCKQFVYQYNLQDYVQFLGEVPHDYLPSIIYDNDIYCQPSRSEGLPAAPLEAMACGLPVVGTNTGGMDEIIKNGFNGLLCKPNSSEDIAEKILKASATNWDRRGISNWVRDNFSWNIWAEGISQAYTILKKHTNIE